MKYYLVYADANPEWGDPTEFIGVYSTQDEANKKLESSIEGNKIQNKLKEAWRKEAKEFAISSGWSKQVIAYLNTLVEYAIGPIHPKYPYKAPDWYGKDIQNKITEYVANHRMPDHRSGYHEYTTHIAEIEIPYQKG